MSNYFPFGFTYPKGFRYSDANPDPGVEAVRKRIEFLNLCHDEAKMPDGSPMPGHFFAAALDLFQKSSDLDVDAFWDLAQTELTTAQIAEIAQALLPKVADALPLLDFPNCVALFDCRFVAVKEWEHLRRYSIGGSEAGTVLGLSHFQSARMLYHEKKSPASGPHSAGTQQIFDYGHCLEDYVIGYVANLLGAKRYPEHRMFAHQKYPFLTCNPDGLLVFPDGHFALYESKTATNWKRDDWYGGIPEYYVPQPRHYLEVLDDPRFNGGYIGCCLGGLAKDIVIHSYDRDKAAGAAQVQKLVDYWETYIVPGVLPDFCGDPELDTEAAYMYDPHLTKVGTDANFDSSNIPEFEQYFQLKTKLKLVSDQANEAKVKENALMAEIKPCAADGLTLCSIPNGMTYKIKISEVNRESVSEKDLPGDIRNWLLDRAAALRDKDTVFTTPKVAMAIKAPTAKKKKTV